MLPLREADECSGVSCFIFVLLQGMEQGQAHLTRRLRLDSPKEWHLT